MREPRSDAEKPPGLSRVVKALLDAREGVALVLAGISLLGAGWVKLHQWSETTGRVTAFTAPTAASRTLKVDYEYFVGGAAHAGSADASDDQKYEFDRLMALRGAPALRVWYDTRDPSHSTPLEEPLGWGWILVLLGLPALVAAGVVLWGHVGRKGLNPLVLEQGIYLVGVVPGILLILLVNIALTGGTTFWLSLAVAVFTALGAGVFLRGLPREGGHGPVDGSPVKDLFDLPTDNRRYTGLLRPSAQIWLVFTSTLTCALPVLLFAFLSHKWSAGARRAEAFLPAQAKVLVSRVKTNQVTGKPALDFRYAYQVEGKEYAAARFGWSGYSGKEFLRQVTSDHRLGSELTAYYNPMNPAEAVIDRGNPREMLLTLLLVQPLAPMLLLTLAWLGRLLRRRRALDNFLYLAPRFPLRLWLWGPVRRELSRVAITTDERAARPMLAALLTYGAVCLVLGAALAATGGSFVADAAVRACFVAAGAIALIVFCRQAARWASQPTSTVTISRDSGWLEVTGPREYDRMALNRVAALVLRQGRRGSISLLARDQDGKELALHRFVNPHPLAGPVTTRVADRAAAVLAALAGISVPVVREVEQSAITPAAVFADEMDEESPADDDDTDVDE